MIFVMKLSESNERAPSYSACKRKDLQRLYMCLHVQRSAYLMRWSSIDGMCLSPPYPLCLNIQHVGVGVITS
jgi:hypothetical protein